MTLVILYLQIQAWAVSFDPKQETNDIGTSNSGTSNSVLSSVELEPLFHLKLSVGMR